VSHHSTSDDSSAYRSKSEVSSYTKDTATSRFYKYLETKGWWNAIMEKEFKSQTRSDVLKAFMAAEKIDKPHWSEMFTDVYDNVPPHLKEQEEQLKTLKDKYKSAFQ
jgi:2-oxoisovalerate dehydrogenase E1 component alpha subunit